MKKSLLLGLFFLLSITVNSQDRFLRKAKMAIDERDRNHALELLVKYESKEGPKPESNFVRFLMNIAFGSNKNDMDDCWIFLCNAINNYSGIPDKNKKEWCEDFDYCDTKFAYYVDLADSMIYEEYKRENNPNEITSFITKYPKSKWFDDARIFKSGLDFKIAASINSEQAYLEYLSLNKGYPYEDSARHLLWNIAFNNVTRENTVSSYERFIKNYSQAPQLKSVKEKLWDLEWKEVVNINRKSNYLAFIDKYPDADQTNEAKSKVERFDWDETVNNPTIQAFEKFISSYPNSKYKTEAANRLEKLKEIKALDDLVTEAGDDVLHIRFDHASELLSHIDLNAPFSYRATKDSLMARISYLKPLTKATLGRYAVNIKGTEVIMVFGANENDSSLFCKIKAFNKGEPINGLESDGIFEFDKTAGVILIDWDVDEFDKTMSSMTVLRNQNKTSIKLLNGTIYKKISEDYTSDIESNVKIATKPNKSSSVSNKKVVCQSEWTTIQDLEDVLESITEDWKQYVENEVRSEYREFADDIQVTNGNSKGIYITATGNSTGATFKILWSCDGTIIIYDAIAN